jgi:hypothetical protein
MHGRARAQWLLEAFPTDGAVEAAVNSHLNPALEAIGLKQIHQNPDTKKVYAASMDGTAVEALINDLFAGFNGDDASLAQEPWGLERSESSFLQGVAKTFKELNQTQAYAAFRGTLTVLQRWAEAFQLALKYKPAKDDYPRVRAQLALYVAEKLARWPKSNTWYDNECMWVLGEMHQQWGSLRLISQEGMEAWQKKLNEILRMGNGFANAGAIPKDVKRAGKAAVQAYLLKRAKDKPSSAQWIYEQAMLQQHAYMANVWAARDELHKEGASIEWGEFTRSWQRYMVCAAMRCRLRARFLRGQTRAQCAAGAAAPAGDDYSRLLAEHRAYYAPVTLTADDLEPAERRRQERQARRERYAALEERKVWGWSLWHAEFDPQEEE